jgi:hypothetical protein
MPSPVAANCIPFQEAKDLQAAETSAKEAGPRSNFHEEKFIGFIRIHLSYGSGSRADYRLRNGHRGCTWKCGDNRNTARYNGDNSWRSWNCWYSVFNPDQSLSNSRNAEFYWGNALTIDNHDSEPVHNYNSQPVDYHQSERIHDDNAGPVDGSQRYNGYHNWAMHNEWDFFNDGHWQYELNSKRHNFRNYSIDNHGKFHSGCYWDRRNEWHVHNGSRAVSSEHRNRDSKHSAAQQYAVKQYAVKPDAFIYAALKRHVI